MTLSVQKNFPFPPAIVIELPHSSPGNSSCGSREDLDADTLGALSDTVDGKLSQSANSPSLRPGIFLSPNVISSKESSSPRSNDTIPNSRPNSRSSRHSVTSATAHPQWVVHPSSSSSKDATSDYTLLDVPRSGRSLSHSHSLRSARSYKERSACFLYPEDFAKNHEFSSGGVLSEFGGSMACCGLHPGMESAHLACPHRYTRHAHYHAHYPYPFFPNDNLSGSNLSQLSALEVMHENCGQLCMRHPAMKGSRSDKPRKVKRSSLTPTYSSSDASSPQLSTNCLLNMSPQIPHSNLSNSFPITTHMAIPAHLRRTSSMSEYATEMKPRRSSDTDFTRYEQLMAQQGTSEPPKSRCRPNGRGVHRHFSLSHGPCFAAHAHDIAPVPCYVGPPTGFLSHNSSYAIRSPLSQRRHTDGTDTKPYWLQPPFHTRRARSVNCQTLGELITQTPAAVSGQHLSHCMSCLNPGTHCTCRGNTSTYSVRIPMPQTETRTSSVLGSDPDNEAVKLWVEDEEEEEQEYHQAVDEDEDEDEEDTRIETRMLPNKSSSNGLCFCQLIVLLVSMQIVLGLAATGLGLYLRWRVPLLPTEECSFWAAVPVSRLLRIFFHCYSGLFAVHHPSPLTQYHSVGLIRTRSPS
ncbi:unnamed protein product [Echinostoma caproni]|uniref:Vesicular, overexpressed in cancer, prosurvival protein 1 n=1 Tax=Echinostoma caproni TaxID=27848 RepID=A0A183B4E2_9TREM|nr:unnamed protein product [Echinostoma caproni]